MRGYRVNEQDRNERPSDYGVVYSDSPRKPAFVCLECGETLSFQEAQDAVNGDGCPTCGGSDIDLEV